MSRFDDPHTRPPGPAAPREVPPGAPRRLDAVESLTQGAKALFTNVLPWVLAMLLVLAVTVGLTLVVVVPLALGEYAAEEEAVALSPAVVAGMILVWIIVFVLSMIWTLNVYRNAVRQVQGETVRVGDFFSPRDLGIPFVAYVVMSLIVLVGLFLLVIPGLVAAVLLMFVPYLAFSRPEGGLAGIFRGSVAIVRRDPGPAVLLILFSLVLNALGSLTIVGVLFTTPLSACMLAYAALQGSGDRVVYRP